MKKLLFLLPLCLMALMACDGGQGQKAQQERDSLIRVLADRDAEINEFMGTINEVQEGFQQINEAEGRITVANGNLENASSRDVIRENITFIQETMQQNREKIARLEEKLKTATINADKLNKTIANLTAQLEQQNKRVQELEAELAEKNIVIAEQGARISSLGQNVSSLEEQKAKNEQTIDEQDKALNTAYFVFGTRKELKEQKIIEKGDVLTRGNFKKDYFMPIDIRIDKEIRLYSKKAELLTSHPAGTYELVKDQKKELTLKITKPQEFWSLSKYLVIEVK